MCFFKHNNVFFPYIYIRKSTRKDSRYFATICFGNDLIIRVCVRINESNVIILENRCIDNLKLYFFFFFFIFSFFFFKHALHRTRYMSFKSWMDQNREFHHIVFLRGSKITGLMAANDLKDRSMIQRRPRMPSRCRSPSLPHRSYRVWSEQGSRIEYIVISVTNKDT